MLKGLYSCNNKHNASWVISNMAATTTLTFFVITNSTWNEYEIIMLISNEKHAGSIY